MKTVLTLIFTTIYIYTSAQVGINTKDPKATLDIKEIRQNSINDVSKLDGIIIPTLTKKELAEKANTTYTSSKIGILVYVNDINETITGPSVNQVQNILKNGFYYLNSNLVWANIESDYSNDAWINNPTNTRIELATNSAGGTRQNNTNVVINDKGFIGINNIAPTKRLDINAADLTNTADNIRIRNLKEIDSSINTSTLVIDDNGNVYKNDVENLNGQIMRIPIADASLGIVFDGQYPLRLDFDVNSVSPACLTGDNSIICNKNFLNTIKGVDQSSLITGKSLTSNTGTTARVTDRVVLPRGTYKVQIKLVGSYINDYNFSSTTPGTTIAKLAIGNREFSITNYTESTSTDNALTSILFTDIIRIPSDDQLGTATEEENRTLDFLIQTLGRTFKLAPNPSENGRKIIKNMILIERLR